jgi:hypothetical protein
VVLLTSGIDYSAGLLSDDLEGRSEGGVNKRIEKQEQEQEEEEANPVGGGGGDQRREALVLRPPLVF